MLQTQLSPLPLPKPQPPAAAAVPPVHPLPLAELKCRRNSIPVQGSGQGLCQAATQLRRLSMGPAACLSLLQALGVVKLWTRCLLPRQRLGSAACCSGEDGAARTCGCGCGCDHCGAAEKGPLCCTRCCRGGGGCETSGCSIEPPGHINCSRCSIQPVAALIPAGVLRRWSTAPAQNPSLSAG